MDDSLIALIIYLFASLSNLWLIPLKDERGPYRSFPRMTAGIVLLNVAVHIARGYIHTYAPDLVSFESQFFLTPARIIRGEGLGAISLVTAAFIHGNLFHLASN